MGDREAVEGREGADLLTSMTRKFEPGDIVQATLDGRKMTVEAYDALGGVHCAWIRCLRAPAAGDVQ